MNLREKKLWIFDVDNTLIKDIEHPEPFKDALMLWKALREKRYELAILTNVGRLSSRQVNQSLTEAGFKIPSDRVFAAAAAYVHNRSPGARCFVISEGGAREDFVARGLDVTNNPPIDFVAVGADRGMTFDELNFATKMVKEGSPLICISGSRDYPGVYLGTDGVFIGERSIAAAIEDATGVQAVIVGKPLPEILIGDNLNSDVAGGNAAGLTTVLVRRDPDDIVDYDSGDMDTTPSVTVNSLDELILQI